MVQVRTKDGKFTHKSKSPRYVRSVRLTDTTWDIINYAADKQGVSVADLLEQMVEEGAFDNPSEYFF